MSDAIIPLLEERLMVDFQRRKRGEIVVRKEIATQIVQIQVPIRREKLIVEQVSPEYQLLAEIDLGRSPIAMGEIAAEIDKTHDDNGIDSIDSELLLEPLTPKPSLNADFNSLASVRDLLAEIANLPADDIANIRLEIVLNSSRQQGSYQELFVRHG